MPETTLSERLFDLALRVNGACRIAEILQRGVPDSILVFKLEDLARVQGVAAGIAVSVTRLDDQSLEGEFQVIHVEVARWLRKMAAANAARPKHTSMTEVGKMSAMSPWRSMTS